MKGFEVIFIAPRSHRLHGKPVLDAIVALARKQGIKRYTRRFDTVGAGASGHTHSAHFFELADEPEELMFVLDGGQADALIRAVETAGAHVFCLRRGIDYWQFGAK
jgi:PII-like signaling protein